MEDFRVRVLNGTYNVEGTGVRIDIFGRTKTGRSISMRYKGFYPYFYIVSPDQNVIQDLMDDPEVVRYSMRMLYVNNVKKDCIKVEIKHPFRVPDYKKRYQNRFKILAADIPFIQRFFYDLNLGSSIWVSGEIITDVAVAQNYTTDLVMDVKEIKLGHSFRTDLKILSFDLENSIRTGRILCLCCAIKGSMGDIRYEVLRGIESDILLGFTKLVRAEDPDILTGYNIDNYDIPYIRKRMVENGMGDSLVLGRNLSPITSDKFIGWNCKGRVIVDAWWQVKKEKRRKRESLSYVS